MFRKIIDLMKGGLHKLGLYSDIKKLTDHKDISIDDYFYEHITNWKQLYAGYFKDHHDYKGFNIDKGHYDAQRHSLKMPKVVSEELATIIYNEKCQINVSQETSEEGSTDKLQEFIEDVLKRNKFNTKFPDFIEKMFALGGGVLKPYVNSNNELSIQFVTADAFLPISYTSTGEVKEGVFIAEIIKGDKKYTHLEWHMYDDAGVYTIKHELYKSDKSSSDIGVKVSITELYPDMTIDEFMFPGITRTLFVYLKPNISNNIDISSPLGISIYANSLDTLKAIDIAFDSFIREFRLGKKRIMVPYQALRTITDPKTGRQSRYFDANDEVFQGFKSESPEQDKIADLSVELRVEEHVSAINAMLNLLSMQTGFSPGAFSFDGQSVKTATEVVSENSKTFRTKQAHEVVIEDALKHLIRSIIELADAFDIENYTDKEYEVSIQFDDSIAQDRTADSAFYLSMVSGKLMSQKKAMMLQFGYTEQEADDEIAQIKAETASFMSGEVDGFGLMGGDADGLR